MADVIYNVFKLNIMNGGVDLDTNTIYVMLVTSAYVADQDLHLDRADVTNEIAGAGYTSGGAEITAKAVTQDDTDNEGVFDGADVTWSTATITARGAVIYKSTGVAANDTLICYLDFGSDQTATGADFTIAWNAEGIVNLN